MKTYHYDTGTGCYLGEDCAKVAGNPEVTGSLTGATSVAAPLRWPGTCFPDRLARVASKEHGEPEGSSGELA